MSEFISIFQPGMAYVFRQRDLDKTLVVEPSRGQGGPQPLDLESGVVEIDVPGRVDGPPESADAQLPSD